MSEKRSTSRSAAKRRSRARQPRTDWERLRRMTDNEAYQNALADPDNQPANAEWLRSASLVMPVTKRAISIRLDRDVVDWFRSTGPRYQSRMNAVLRAFMEHNRLRSRRAR